MPEEEEKKVKQEVINSPANTEEKKDFNNLSEEEIDAQIMAEEEASKEERNKSLKEGQGFGGLLEELEEELPSEKVDPSKPTVTNFSTDPSKRVTFTTESQKEELENKGQDPWVFAQGSQDFNNLMLREQGAGEAIGRALVGGGYKGVLGVVENVGYLADVPDWFRLTNDFDKGVTNFLSDWASDKSKEYSENNPIYTQEGSMDFGFWLNTFQSVVESGVEFGAVGFGVGSVMGMSARALRAKNVITSMLGEKAFTTMGTAVATNYVESRMMAAETYNNVYEQSLNNGLSEKEARAKASDKAVELLWKNKVMIATDAISIGKSLNLANFTKGNAEKTIKKTLVSGGIDSAGEALEETYGGVLSKELERDANLETGGTLSKEQKGSFVGRTANYMVSNEGLQEMFAGALGGPIQSLATKPVKKITESIKDEVYPEFKTPRVEKPKVVEDPGKAPVDPKTLEKLNSVAVERYDNAVKEWDEYQEKKKAYDDYKVQEQKFEEYNKEKEKYEFGKKRFEELKKVGNVKKAKADIDNITKNDEKLRQEYKDALLSGDETKAASIQEEMFEGIFTRYAQKGTTELLEDHLDEVIKNSQNENEVSSARKFKANLGKYQSEYGKLMNDKGVEMANIIFPIKARLNSSKELLKGEAQQKINDSYDALSKSLDNKGEKDENGNDKTLTITQRAIIEEKAKLESIEELKNNPQSKTIELELDAREKSLKRTIQELEKQQKELGGQELKISNKATEEFKNYVKSIKDKENLANSVLVYEKYYNQINSDEFTKKYKEDKFKLVNDKVDEMDDLNELEFLAKNVGSFNFDKKQSKAIKKKLEEKQNKIVSERKAKIEEYNKIVEQNKQLKKSIDLKSEEANKNVDKINELTEYLSDDVFSTEELDGALDVVGKQNKNIEKFDKKTKELEEEIAQKRATIEQLETGEESSNSEVLALIDEVIKLEDNLSARKQKVTHKKSEELNAMKSKAQARLDSAKESLLDVAKKLNKDFDSNTTFDKGKKKELDFIIKEIEKGENLLENINTLEEFISKELKRRKIAYQSDSEIINKYVESQSKIIEEAVNHEIYKAEQKRKLELEKEVEIEDAFEGEEFLNEEIYQNAFAEKPMFEENTIKALLEKEKKDPESLSNLEETFVKQYKKAYGIVDKKEEVKKEEEEEKKSGEALSNLEEATLTEEEKEKKKEEYLNSLDNGFDSTVNSGPEEAKGVEAEDSKRPNDERIDLASNETTDQSYEKQNILNPVLENKGKELRNPKLEGYENSLAYATKVYDENANDSIERAFSKGLIVEESEFKIELEKETDLTKVSSLSNEPIRAYLVDNKGNRIKLEDGTEVYAHLRIDSSLIGSEKSEMTKIRRGILESLKNGEEIYVPASKVLSGVFRTGPSLSSQEILNVVDPNSIMISSVKDGKNALITSGGALDESFEPNTLGLVYVKDAKTGRNVRMTLNKVSKPEADLIGEVLGSISKFNENESFDKKKDFSNTTNLSPQQIIDMILFEGGKTMNKKSPFFISLKEKVVYYGENKITFKEIRENPSSLKPVKTYIQGMYKTVNIDSLGNTFKDLGVLSNNFTFLGKEYSSDSTYNEFVIENGNVTLNQELNASGDLLHQPLVFLNFDDIKKDEKKEVTGNNSSNSNASSSIKSNTTEAGSGVVNEEIGENQVLNGGKKQVDKKEDSTYTKRSAIEKLDNEFNVEGSGDLLNQESSERYTKPKEWLLEQIDEDARENVSNVIDILSETQNKLKPSKQTTLDENGKEITYYEVNENGETILLNRVSSIKGTKFEGTGDYSNAAKAGTSIDLLFRELINKGDVGFNEEVLDDKTNTKFTFSELFESEELFNQYREDFKKTLKAMESRGYYPVIVRNGNDQNIRLYDQELGMAGEIDLLFVSKKGKFLISDIKTANKIWNELQKKYTNNLITPFVENGKEVTKATRSKIDDYALQLAIYSVIFEKMTGAKSSNEVVFVPVDYDSEGILIDDGMSEPGVEGVFKVKSNDTSSYAPMTGKVEYVNKKKPEIKVRKEEATESNNKKSVVKGGNNKTKEEALEEEINEIQERIDEIEKKYVNKNDVNLDNEVDKELLKDNNLENIAKEEGLTPSEVKEKVKEEIVSQMNQEAPEAQTTLQKVASKIRVALLNIMVAAATLSNMSFTFNQNSEFKTKRNVEITNLESWDKAYLSQEEVNRKENIDVITKGNESKEGSYLIVDKQNQLAHLYNGSNLITTYEVGTGKNKGDAQTKTVVRDGKVYWEEGNKETGAGIYKVSGKGKYKSSPSFTLKNERGIEVPTVLHQTLSNRKKLFKDSDVENNRMSFGCVNFQAESLQDLGKDESFNKDSDVYILPDNEENKFQLKDGEIKFVSNDKNVNKSLNTYIPKPITLKSSVDRLGEINNFVDALYESKADLMSLQSTVSNDVYNQIAKIAYGIAGQESSFGSYGGLRGQTGRITDLAQIGAIELGSDLNPSIGIGQIRLSSVRQEAREKFGINSAKDLLDSKKNAQAVMSLLLDIYVNEVPNKDKGNLDLLPAIYSNQRNLLGKSDISSNTYVKSVKEKSKELDVYIGQQDDESSQESSSQNDSEDNSLLSVPLALAFLRKRKKEKKASKKEESDLKELESLYEQLNIKKKELSELKDSNSKYPGKLGQIKLFDNSNQTFEEFLNEVDVNNVPGLHEFSKEFQGEFNRLFEEELDSLIKLDEANNSVLTSIKNNEVPDFDSSNIGYDTFKKKPESTIEGSNVTKLGSIFGKGKEFEKVKVEEGVNKGNSKETFKAKKVEKNDNAQSFSRISDEEINSLTERDLTDEINWLKEVLPEGMPVRIVNTLIPTGDGGYAEGVFDRGMIKLSTMSKQGVAYHEGFHAVTQMFLNEQEIAELYDEYRKKAKDNSLSDLAAEEGLAEEFRRYMINHKKNDSNIIQKLFNWLKDLIKAYTSKKGKLFRNIRKGKYKSGVVNETEAKLFSRLGVESQVYHDGVELITYATMVESGILLDEDNAVFDEDQEETKELKEKVLNFIMTIGRNRVESLEEAEEKNETEKVNVLGKQVDNLASIVRNFDDFYEASKIRISEMNLSTKEEVDEDREEGSKELFAKSHLEYNGKDNATGHTKLLMSVLMDPTKRTDSFGTPSMRNDAWEQIGNMLGNLTSYEDMKERLENNKKMLPYIPDLLKRLNQLEENNDYFKIAQFTQAFSKQLITYVGHYYESGDKTKTKIGNADNMSIGKDLMKNAISSIYSKFYDSYGELDRSIDTIQKELNKSLSDLESVNDRLTVLKNVDFPVIKYKGKNDEEIFDDKARSYKSYLSKLENFTKIEFGKPGNQSKALLELAKNKSSNEVSEERANADAGMERYNFTYDFLDVFVSKFGKENFALISPNEWNYVESMQYPEIKFGTDALFYSLSTKKRLQERGITEEMSNNLRNQFVKAFDDTIEEFTMNELRGVHDRFSQTVYGFDAISFETTKAIYNSNADGEFNPFTLSSFVSKHSPSIGMNFTKKTDADRLDSNIESLINEDYSFIDSEVRSVRQLVNNLSHINSKSDLSSSDKRILSENLFKQVVSPTNAFVNNFTETREWFAFEGVFSDRPSSQMVSGPNNNKYSNKSEFNFLRSRIEEIRNGKGKELYEGVIWGGDSINYDNKNIGIESFLLSKDQENGAMDGGSSYSDLDGVDEIITRMNLHLEPGKNKKIAPLTPGDKSVLWLMTGITDSYRNQNVYYKDSNGQWKLNASAENHRYLVAEAKRINHYLAKQKDGGSNIKTINKEGLKFQVFPSLNKYLNGQENPYFKMVDGLIDVNELQNRSTQDRAKTMTEFMAPLVDKTFNELNKLGLIEFTNGEISGIKGVKNGGKDIKGVYEAIAEYLEVSIMGNAEYSMLFTGDPAFYGKLNLSKRVQATSAQGTQNNDLSKQPKDSKFYVPEKYKIAIGEDIQKANSLYEEYAQFYEEKGEDVESLDSYLENNQTDGISYITPKRYRDLMMMQGQWSDFYEDAYNEYLEKGKVTNKLKEMQNLKGVHFELVGYDGQNLPVYLKYSQMVLWGGLTKETKLENLKNLMESQGIDEYVTGIKVGVHNTSSLEDVIEGRVTELSTIDLSNKHWRLQQDLRSKYSSGKKNDSTVASQAIKNITMNITTLDRQNKDKVFKDDATENKLTGKEVAKLMHNLQSSISNDHLQKLESKWGMEGSIDDKKFSKMLAKSLAKKKMPLHIIEAVERGVPLDSIFQIRNSLQTELRSTINKSVVKSKSFGGSFIQTPSAGLTGLNDQDLTKLAKSKDQAIFFEDVKELKGPRFKKEGNEYVLDDEGERIVEEGEIMLPFKYVEMIPNWERLSNEELKEKLSDVINQIVGMRIPNQGMASIDALKVVGVIPKSMGDTVAVYTGLTSKTGSDFDIDKLYLLLPNAKYNPNTGKVERVQYNQGTDLESIEKRYEDKLEEFVKTHLRDSIKKEITERLKKVKGTKEYIDFVRAKQQELQDMVTVETDKDKKFIANLNKRYLKLEEELDLDNDKINKDFIEDVRLDVSEEFKLELIDAGLFPNLEDFMDLPIEDQNTLQAKENRRIELWRTVLLSEAMFHDAIRPIDSVELKNNSYHISFLEDLRNEKIDIPLFEEIIGKGINEANLIDSTKELVKAIEKYRKEEEFYDLQLFDPFFQMKIKEQNVGSKIGVGQGANHLSHHALAQTVDLSIKVTNMESATELSLNGEFERSVPGRSVQRRISDNINAYLNAFLDNAKDPYISKANINKTTTNTAFFLIRSGYPLESVNFFLSQPIIKEMVFQKMKADSTYSDTEFIQFKKLKVTEDEETGLNKQEISDKKQPLDHFAKAWGMFNRTEDGGVNYNMTDNKVDFDEMLMNLNKLKQESIKPDDEFQRNVLIAYMNLSERASKLNNLVKASKIDTEGMGISFAQEMVKKSLMDRVQESKAFNNADKLFEDTFLKTYKENTFDYYNKFSHKRFINGKQEFKDIVLETIEESNFDISEWESERNVRKVENGLYNYIYSQIPLFKEVSKEQRFELFFGESSVANLANKIKTENLLTENLFINELIIKFGESGEPSFVGANSKERDNTFVDNLTEAFEDLYMMPKDLFKFTNEQGEESIYTSEDFAKDLVKQSFFSSGFSSSLYSIHNLIPASFNENYGINEFINGVTNEGLNFSQLEIEEFKRDFFLNNWEDKKIVKTMGDKTYAKIDKSDLTKGIYINKENFTGRLNDEDEPISNKVVNVSIRGANFFEKSKKVTFEYSKVVEVKKGNKTEEVYLFVPVETKGYYNKGYRMKEYGVSTIVPQNRISRKISVKKNYQGGHFHTETAKQQIKQLTQEELNSNVESAIKVDNYTFTEMEAMGLNNEVSTIDDLLFQANDALGFEQSDKFLTLNRFKVDRMIDAEAVITTGTIINSNNAKVGSETLKGFNKVDVLIAQNLGKPTYVFHKGTGERPKGWYYWNGEEFKQVGKKINLPANSLIIPNAEYAGKRLEETSDEKEAIISLGEKERVKRKEIDKGYVEMPNYKGYSNGKSKEWDLIGERFGFVNTTHFVESNSKLDSQLVNKRSDFELFKNQSKEDQTTANVEVSRAGAELGYIQEEKSFSNIDYVNAYFEIKDADSVFIVGEFINEGSKLGYKEEDKRLAKVKQVKKINLGLRAQLAINMNKPVFVFDQNTSKWNTFSNSQGWRELDATPSLTNDYAAYNDELKIGKGDKAIQFVFKRTLELEGKNPSVKKVKTKKPLVIESTKALTEVKDEDVKTDKIVSKEEQNMANVTKDAELAPLKNLSRPLSEELIEKESSSNDGLEITELIKGKKFLYKKNGIEVTLTSTTGLSGKTTLKVGDKEYKALKNQSLDDVKNFLEKVNFTKIDSVLEAITNCVS
jgi:hypothetical protein